MDILDLFNDSPMPKPIRLPVLNPHIPCDVCHERPLGCWKNQDYSCSQKYMQARKQAWANKSCPIGKMGPVQRYYLPEVKTIVYTTPWQKARQDRVTALLESQGFSDWEFHLGTNPTAGSTDIWGRGKDYWKFIPHDHAALLRKYDPPLLIVEDDISPRDFQPNIIIPENADMIMLGGGRGGESMGVAAAVRNTNQTWYRQHRYCFQPYDETWMRVAGMWFTHAVMHIDKQVMMEVADCITSRTLPIDTSLARNQWRWNVFCRRVPMWWQDDGKHRRDTFDYAPSLEYGMPLTPPPVSDLSRPQQLRQQRQKSLKLQ